jgi:hypothetical protein
LKIRVDCITNYPVTLTNSIPPSGGNNSKNVYKYGEDFEWIPDFSFVSENDGEKLSFQMGHPITQVLLTHLPVFETTQSLYSVNSIEWGIRIVIF